MTNVKNNNSYIPEIDGLRAIAVLGVILYHFGVPYFDGGFVGVDVFFVISGYLITGLLCKQIKDQNFTFSAFYMKRIRRLFPAMIAVYGLCFVSAYFLLNPQNMERFSGALIYALGSFSNVYFFQESGYFDADSYVKPLLHTWSLSVEEQFYMIWPLALFFCRHHFKTIIAVLSVLSFLACLYVIDSRPSLAFFMMPFRIFEFGIGAALLWIKPININKYAYEVMSLIGLALIVYSIITFSKDTIFPGWNALIPCIGTALLIFSRQSISVGSLLRLKVSNHLGKLSYSLYLVHWPIVVFYKAATFSVADSLNLYEIILLLVSTYIAGLLLFHFVETRFRYPSENAFANSQFGLSCSVGVMSLVLLASTAWAQSGWAWRITGLDQKLRAQMVLPKEVYTSYAYDQILEINHKPFNKENTKKVLIIGDSQAGDFVNMLYENGYNTKIDLKSIVIGAKCQPILVESSVISKHIPDKYKKGCLEQRKSYSDSGSIAEADVIVLSANWRSWSSLYIEDTLKNLRKKTKADILILGHKTQGKSGQELLLENKGRSGLELLSSKSRYEPSWTINTKLEEKIGSGYLNIMDLICPDMNSCHVLTKNDDVIFFDRSHVTPEGARYLGRLMRDNGMLDRVL